MGTASSSIVVNASPATSSSPSSSASSDPVIDALIKTLICAGGGCDDKLMEMASACGYDRFNYKWLPPPATDVEACAKAAAALRECMAAKTARYDALVGSGANKK